MGETGSAADRAGGFFQLARDADVEQAGAASAEVAPALGARFAGFEIQGLLGRGAMGQVYRARDASGRPVALKLSLQGASPERLRREGELAAALRHPNVLTIHAAGEERGRLYLAYELIEGCRTLDEVLAGVAPTRRLELLRDAARGVGFAHSRGVIHRDLKPENILVDADLRVRVADFGLGRTDSSQRLTASGTFLGTPLFMSPEQFIDTAQVGRPSDVYALGVILYRILTGTDPFEAGTLLHHMALVTEGDVRPPRQLEPSVSEALEAVCLRALERAPERRYPHADAFADDLDAVLEGRDPAALARRRWKRALPGALVGSALVVVVTTGLVARSWSRPGPDAGAPAVRAPEVVIPPTPTTETPTTERLAPPPLPPAPITGATEGFALELSLAEDGHAGAAWKVALRLETGEGVDSNRDQARRWFDRAAELDPKFATRMSGRLQKQQDPEALTWLRRGADGGDPDAMFQLALKLLDGEGVALDPVAANGWLERASLVGHDFAKVHLAESYLQGRGGARNVARAVELLEEAARAGNRNAQERLARLRAEPE